MALTELHKTDEVSIYWSNKGRLKIPVASGIVCWSAHVHRQQQCFYVGTMHKMSPQKNQFECKHTRKALKQKQMPPTLGQSRHYMTTK